MTISLLRINLSCNRADFQSANQIYGLSVHSGLVSGVVFIILGISLIIWTIIDSKNVSAKFENSYINHLKGYIGGFGLLGLGLNLIYC